VVPDVHIGPIVVVIVPPVFDVHALVGDQICGSDVAVAAGGNNPRRLKRIKRDLEFHLKELEVLFSKRSIRCRLT